MRGVRYARRGQYKAAAIIGTVGLAELGGYAVARGTGAFLVGIAIVLGATGLGLRKLTDGGAR
jgi:hypothetical protein